MRERKKEKRPSYTFSSVAFQSPKDPRWLGCPRRISNDWFPSNKDRRRMTQRQRGVRAAGDVSVQSQ